jgi:hypothetical protein
MSLKENLITLWKNRGQIVEGVMNNVFKKEDVEEIAQERMQVCHKCALIDMHGTGCMMPGTEPCCNKDLGGCGCSLKLKTRSLSSDCPLGHWKAVLTQEEEDQLNQKLGL